MGIILIKKMNFSAYTYIYHIVIYFFLKLLFWQFWHQLFKYHIWRKKWKYVYIFFRINEGRRKKTYKLLTCPGWVGGGVEQVHNEASIFLFSIAKLWFFKMIQWRCMFIFTWNNTSARLDCSREITRHDCHHTCIVGGNTKKTEMY